MHGRVRLRPMKVDSGPGTEGRALPDTGIQINVISGGMFAKLPAKYPLTTLLTQSTFPVVLADRAIPQAVGTTEPLNITVTSGVAGPVQVSLMVFVVSKGDDDLLSLGVSSWSPNSASTSRTFSRICSPTSRRPHPMRRRVHVGNLWG